MLSSDCVLWEGKCLSSGYGYLQHHGKKALAHRLAYCEAHGLTIEDIKGQVVRHECDNPSCVNPEHLAVGSQAENLSDMVKRGRSARGPKNGRSKLGLQDVLAIRRRYKLRCKRNGAAALAAEYGVDRRTINDITSGRRWAWVEQSSRS